MMRSLTGLAIQDYNTVRRAKIVGLGFSAYLDGFVVFVPQGVVTDPRSLLSDE